MPLIRQLNGTVSNTTAGNSTFSTDNNENVVSTSTLKIIVLLFMLITASLLI